MGCGNPEADTAYNNQVVAAFTRLKSGGEESPVDCDQMALDTIAVIRRAEEGSTEPIEIRPLNLEEAD